MKNRAIALSALFGVVGLTLACSGTGLIVDPDGGELADSGHTPLPEDSGRQVDTGTRRDTGTQQDTGTEIDSGDPIDASTKDSSAKDAAPPKDGGIGGDSGKVCYDGSLAGIYPTQAPQLHQNKATQADIQAFYNACFSLGANQATCDAYVGTNAAPLHQPVVNCIFPFYNPALTLQTLQQLPSPALLPFGDSSLGVNVGACRALAANAPAGCALSSANLAVCTTATCESCSDDASYDACLVQSAAEDCASYVPGAACDAAVANGAAAADALCGVTGLTFDDYYFKVATAFCGP